MVRALFVALHNLEEGLTMPAWFAANLADVKRIVPAAIAARVPLDMAAAMPRSRLIVALTIATVVPFAIAAIALSRRSRGGIGAVLMLQAVVAVNAVFPHVLATLVLARYTPGVITALLVNLPFSWYLFREAIRDGTIAGRTAMVMIVAAAILYVPAVQGIYALSALIANAR